VGSPLTSKSQPKYTLFYQTLTFKLVIDPLAFNTTTGLTYTLKGTLNDDKIYDENNYEVYVGAYASADTSFTLTHFYPTTLSNAQSGVIVEGYVKATDAYSRSAYSRFEILKIRKLFFILLILFSMP
jgi:hypothetical protein